MTPEDQAQVDMLKSLLATARLNEQTQRARADAAEKERDAAHRARREALRGGASA